MKHSYVVVALGRRDSYQVPLALHERGHLATYVTDLYAPDVIMRSPGIRPLVGRLARRYEPRLTSGRVDARLALKYLAMRVLMKLGSTRETALDDSTGRRAARLAQRYRAGAVVYSYHWRGFANEHNRAISAPCVLFQVHPIPSQVRDVLERARSEDWQVGEPEWEETLSPSVVESHDELARRADAVICTSTFVKRGLLAAGIEPDRIHVVPYGTQPSTTEPSPRRPSGPTRLLWVGTPCFRKGIHVLDQALRRVDVRRLELTIVSHRLPEPLPQRVASIARVVRDASAERLDMLYRSHDALVLPSLIEGFGHVYVEALSRGTPIVATSNSGAPDLLNMAQTPAGLLVEPGNVDALADSLILMSDPAHRKRVALAASAHRGLHSWETFRQGVADALEVTERRILNGPEPAI